MTSIYDIKSWDDYWKIFDELCNSLTKQDKTEIVTEFKDAQKYVNGFTDGWFDFLDKFNTIYKSYINDFQFDDKEKCKLLIDALTASLKGR